MQYQEIPTRLIDIGAAEQRFTYDDQEQEELTASIRRDGIRVPLTVTPTGERFLLIDGHRRLQAARTIGLEKIPVLIPAQTSESPSRAALVLNMFRKDPSPVELAVAIAKAIDAGTDSEEDIAKGLGRSVDWVKRQLALLQWPEDVLAAVHRGKLSLAAASNLAVIDDDTYRQFLLDHATANGATARTTAAWLQEWQSRVPMQEAVTAPAIPGAPAPTGLAPQAPCFGCGTVHRTDELSHLPLCTRCIAHLRQPG